VMVPLLGVVQVDTYAVTSVSGTIPHRNTDVGDSGCSLVGMTTCVDPVAFTSIVAVKCVVYTQTLHSEYHNITVCSKFNLVLLMLAS